MIDGLAVHGLKVAGAFHAGPDDGAPDGTGTLCLIGADGAQMWNAFEASPEAHDRRPDPLDRWSVRVLTAMADRIGATAIFPFVGPPWAPFIAWARRAEGARVSPVVMQVTAGRGLWTSYRGALALPGHLPRDPSRGPMPALDPCLGCPAPCLDACPVDAFADGRYDVPACVAHVSAPEGRACRDGCLVRHACPAGRHATPPPAQCRFHMAAFLRAQGGAVGRA